jgi:hypothetical protein
MLWRSRLLVQASVIAILMGVMALHGQAQVPIGAFRDALGFTMSELGSKLGLIYDLGTALEDAALFVEKMAAFENEHAEYPFDTVDSRLARILRQQFLLVDMAQVVGKNVTKIGIGPYLEIISILNAASLSLGQQQQYIILHNALPPIEPYVVDRRTVEAMNEASQFAKDKAALLKYVPERVYAGVAELSGGALDAKMARLVLAEVTQRR